MIIPDVNVLVYAARSSAPDHLQYRAWLERAMSGIEPVGLSELVLSGVVRVLTNARIFADPLLLPDALAYVNALRAHPNVVNLRPSDRHWTLFARLAAESGCRGNLVADAYHAALAMEHGATWISTDRDFVRFRGLRWKHPLTDAAG